MFHIICACKFVWRFEARLLTDFHLQRPVYFAFMTCPVTVVLMMIGLDVCLFVSDVVFATPFVDRHVDLSRDIGRALFGCVPTAILQSVTFKIGTNAWNGLVLTTQTFVTAFVASGLQLLKLTGELMCVDCDLMYDGMHTVFWKVLVAKNVIDVVYARSDHFIPGKLLMTGYSATSDFMSRCALSSQHTSCDCL